MNELDRAEYVIKSVIVKAGKVTLNYFGKIGVKYTKNNKADVVTEADLESNRIIVSAIKKNFPDHGIISEESPDFNIDNNYVWIIDPLDGTRNYSRHTPEYGVMVALCYKREVVLSAIYLPYFKELYFARKGRGAYLNGKRIHCAKTKDYPFSFGIIGSIWTTGKRKFMHALMDAAGDDSVWLSSFGASAMVQCMMASGKRDWTILQNHNIWDVAPGYLLLKESGCVVTRFNGTPWVLGDTDLVAANPLLHKKLLSITKKLV